MLNISPEAVCYIIVKAREFDVKVAPGEPDPGSNPSDDGDVEILEDYEDDPTYEELVSAIGALNDDQQWDLLALLLVGRGDYSKDEFQDAREEAQEYRGRRLVNYVVGTPLLGDYLEEALSEFGYSCEDYEIDRL
jgi:hypothetical protein